MHIKKIVIQNIRSIDKFSMEFKEPKGWHVLIGDNGAGKSTIIKSIATMLIGPDEIEGTQPNWNNWLQWKKQKGSIRMTAEREKGVDVQGGTSGTAGKFDTELKWLRSDTVSVVLESVAKSNAEMTLWGGKSGWFSAGFGPFRRFTGGSKQSEGLFHNPRYTRLASHLTLFGEEYALTETTRWLMDLKFRSLEKHKSERAVIDGLTKLVNSDDFLPHGAKLYGISSEGVIIKDGNGAEIPIDQMSDGYRSILSLTFELLRQLIRVYGADEVFRPVREDRMRIECSGVVLIDEVDAHLHPTWQTRIGQWFLKYFPNIQFIVTSHSPLVCRASDKGSIWRLQAPGTKHESGQVKGAEYDRLVYGNVLDAYGTDVFGEAVSISKTGNDKRTRMGELNMKSIMTGDLSANEQKELQELKRIFPTEKILIPNDTAT